MTAALHIGVRSALPNELPTLDRATEAALRASIERHGVLVPVAEDQHGRTLDGHHRRRLADALGVDCPVAVFAVDDDDHARELARELNLTRRHLTPEQRKVVVASLRGDGHSLRAIAGAVGVDDRTVRRDLGAGAAHAAPGRTVGRDGKKYPARRRAKKTVEPPTLWVRFHVAVGKATDVLEQDPATVAAAVPADQRENWALELRALARLAVALADELAGSAP